MTWQAATFAGLALVLAGGFWWYERTRPSARVVALVAALAALAIAGRLVLAPIPNVVATTDIALITGYALGAGPGFAVGALAAPISNIWLGQGPWTAWEMAGWGLVGLGGAWVAAITRRRLGRLGLATVCALAGFAYGALLDLSVMVTYGGEQSLDRYLALSARGLPFNIAHAAGNFVIALAAGPALVRMISRFRTRLEFSWRPVGAIGAALAALVLVANSGPQPAQAKRSATSWLVAAQNDDGGFAATPGQPSSPAMTGWAMLGLEATGRNPHEVRSGGATPVSYLRSQASRLRSVGDLERTILALVGAGIDPRRFAGQNLVADLRARRAGDGSVDGQVNLTAFYALAIRAAGGRPPALARTASWLRRAQNGDGGWGIQPQAPSEADSSGAALQGLVAAGARGAAIARGARWLRRAQHRGGGYALGSSGVVNSQSTAWAVQGLVAAGGGDSAIEAAEGYLSRLRAADDHYRYSATSDQTPIWVTGQVLLAVERQPFPLAPVARSRSARSGADSGGSGSGADPSAAQSGTGGGRDPAPAPSGSGGAGGGGTAAEPSSPRSPGGGSPPGAEAEAPASATESAATSDPASGAAASAPAGAEEPADPVAEPVAVSVSYGDRDGTATGADTYLLAGLAVLGLVAAGGYLWHRRRAR